MTHPSATRPLKPSQTIFSAPLKDFKVAVVVFQVDSSLSFLDGFVSEALAAGAAPYKPPHQRQEELARAKGEKKIGRNWEMRLVFLVVCLFVFLTVMSPSALTLEPYGLSLPISMSSCSIADRQSPTLLSMSSGLSGNSTDLSHKGGYVDTESCRSRRLRAANI